MIDAAQSGYKGKRTNSISKTHMTYRSILQCRNFGNCLVLLSRGCRFDCRVAHFCNLQQMLFVQSPSDKLHGNRTPCHTFRRIYDCRSANCSLPSGLECNSKLTVLPNLCLELTTGLVLWLRVLARNHLRDWNSRRAVVDDIPQAGVVVVAKPVPASIVSALRP